MKQETRVMNFNISSQAQYNAKKMTADQAAQLVRNGDFIVIPTGAGEPPTLLTALSDIRSSLQDVKVSSVLPMRKFAYLDPETYDNVRHVGYFLSGANRAGAQAGWVDIFPNNFSEVPRKIERGTIGADVVFALCSPMDAHGNFSISLGVDYTMAAIKKARVIVLEVNPNVPFAYGDCHVHISQITGLVEDDAPVIEVGLPKIGPVQEAIGKYVADLIEDGSTLQIGYGGIPDAVVMQLTNKRDLGIHTEMLGKMVATFALGSKKLHQFMDRNPMLEMHPVNFTNDPFLAGQNDNLMSINATLQIDFLGQCGSESLGPLPFSSTGGQTDFVRAANRSRGGKSFIVLPSTAKDDTVSRIAPMLTQGTAVSTSKNEVNYVVTEYGVAQLDGKSIKQRALELISIAHPNFRPELTEAAKKMKLI
jgi:acyl-CoA hydrolase